MKDIPSYEGAGKLLLPGPEPARPSPIEIDESMLSIPPGAGPEGLVIALRRAKLCLIGARRVEECKVIADLAQAVHDYAVAQNLGEEIITEATHLRAEALIRLGALWSAAPKNPGTRMRGKNPGEIGGVYDAPPIIPTMEQQGLDKHTVRTAVGLYRLSAEHPGLAQEVLDGKRSITNALKAQYRTEAKRAAVAGDGVILEGDPPPPWQPGEVLDALVARACLDAISRLPVFAAEGHVQTGCRTRIVELDRILADLLGRDEIAAAQLLLSEALERRPSLEQLVFHARTRLRRKA